MIIAIDGPASSGKSSTAKLLAERFGFVYLDTGAMYRAVALAVINSGIDSENSGALEQLLSDIEIDVRFEVAGNRIYLDAVDVTEQIRSRLVTAESSRVSAKPEIRAKMVAEQQRIARRHARENRGVVVDGRDIGTVVFPDADIKIFMTADVDTRARRRHLELAENKIDIGFDNIRQDIIERDRKDQSRAYSPLVKAPDAIEIDTSGISLDEQVEQIAALIEPHLRKDSMTINNLSG